MKSSMTSIRVIYVHREREKVDFKSREVNCLKECALALTSNATIFQLYVTAHRFEGGLKKKFDLVHVLWFYNVPIQAPTWGYPFYTVIQRNATFNRLLRHAGDTKDTF